MILANYWLLHLFWLLPLAAVALVVSSRQKRRALEGFADQTGRIERARGRIGVLVEVLRMYEHLH